MGWSYGEAQPLDDRTSNLGCQVTRSAKNWATSSGVDPRPRPCATIALRVSTQGASPAILKPAHEPLLIVGIQPEAGPTSATCRCPSNSALNVWKNLPWVFSLFARTGCHRDEDVRAAVVAGVDLGPTFDVAVREVLTAHVEHAGADPVAAPWTDGCSKCVLPRPTLPCTNSGL